MCRDSLPYETVSTTYLAAERRESAATRKPSLLSGGPNPVELTSHVHTPPTKPADKWDVGIHYAVTFSLERAYLTLGPLLSLEPRTTAGVPYREGMRMGRLTLPGRGAVVRRLRPARSFPGCPLAPFPFSTTYT